MLKSTKEFIKVEMKIRMLGSREIVFKGRINLKVLSASKFEDESGNKPIKPVITITKSNQFQGSLK